LTEYIDLGWANGWGENPEIVKECKKAGHKKNDICYDSYGLHNKVVCHICKYIYHYDSSG